jgi:hypothetical protein
MSMIGHFRHISARALDALIRDPELSEVIGLFAAPSASKLPPELEAMIAKMPPEQAALMMKGAAQLMAQNGLLDALQALQAPAAAKLEKAGLDASDIAVSPLSVEKAWQGLHLVLSGFSEGPTPPPGSVVLGGIEIGEDLAYGPMRYLTVEEVAVAASSLLALGVEDFRARCDLEALVAAKAYAINPDDPSAADWLTEAYSELREYFRQATGLGRAMVIYLT